MHFAACTSHLCTTVTLWCGVAIRCQSCKEVLPSLSWQTQLYRYKKKPETGFWVPVKARSPSCFQILYFQSLSVGFFSSVKWCGYKKCISWMWCQLVSGCGCRLPPTPSCVAAVWILCVSLFRTVLCFLDFYRIFVPCLYLFQVSLVVSCCCTLVLPSFLSSHATGSRTCEGSRVGRSSTGCTIIFLGPSCLPHPERIIICSPT